MQYVEAFRSLGYEPPNPRQDWSAEGPDGVCVTLWKSQVDWTPPPPRFDLWEKFEPGANAWEALPGHRKRTAHIAAAVARFGRWVDVVIVNGVPGEGYGSADPWSPEERMNHKWRIQKFDDATGFFAVAAEKSGQETSDR